MTDWLFIVKIIFILFGLFFFGGTIYFLVTTTYLKRLFLQDWIEVLTYKPYWIRAARRKWQRVKKRLASPLESEHKLAVIEAGSMLDNALAKMGYYGETLEERLEKVSKETLPNLEEIKEVNKIYYSVLHDPDYKLILNDAKRVLSVYEEALKNLEVIL
ncbi:hypothetical protein J7L36_00270 [bacterium]|nr:hypothetical protein [bacterium]